MSRHAIAAELQTLLQEIQRAARGAEQLALSSKMINPSYFRSIQSAVSLAAGELDQKGLLNQAPQPAAAPVEPAGSG